MDRRGIAESVGGALVSGTLAAAICWVTAGSVDWVLVVGLSAAVAIAAAANYRARIGHAEAVASTAPDADGEDRARTTAGDGGTEPTNTPSTDRGEP